MWSSDEKHHILQGKHREIVVADEYQTLQRIVFTILA